MGRGEVEGLGKGKGQGIRGDERVLVELSERREDRGDASRISQERDGVHLVDKGAPLLQAYEDEQTTFDIAEDEREDTTQYACAIRRRQCFPGRVLGSERLWKLLYCTTLPCLASKWPLRQEFGAHTTSDGRPQSQFLSNGLGGRALLLQRLRLAVPQPRDQLQLGKPSKDYVRSHVRRTMAKNHFWFIILLGPATAD